MNRLNSDEKNKIAFNDRQVEQENEYFRPVHWLMRRALKERYSNLSKILASLIGKNVKSGSILDVGCGDGKGINDIYRLLGEGYSYTGIDYSERAMLFAKAFNYGTKIKFAITSAGCFKEALGDNDIGQIAEDDPTIGQTNLFHL